MIQFLKFHKRGEIIMKIKMKILMKLQTFLIVLNSFLFFSPINVYATAAHTDSEFMTKFYEFIEEYRAGVNVVVGLLLLLSMFTFIYHIVKLVQAADNPQQRKEAINNILICGVCLAIQGSVSIFIMLYFYLFN